MKNAFYFYFKSFFILKVLKFLSYFFPHVEKRLDYKGKVNSKIFGVTSGKQTILIHILPNILRSTCNQKIIFCQLIEYNMKNIFLEKPIIKCDGESIPRPFCKSSQLNISLDQLCKVLCNLFLLYAKLRAI